MKKVLLTGGSGFVGSRFLNRWGGMYDILAPTHQEFDITCDEAVARYMDEHRPDVVLHLAAISNTGYCEEHPQESYEVNALAPARLARECARLGAKLVFFSSDQIYNGNMEKGLLTEDLPVQPVNHYGRHKLEAELMIQQADANAVMLRATWMYDIPREGMPAHMNFYVNICKAVEQGTPLRFATHEHRGITHTDEVVELLPLTFDLPGGVYNYGAENVLTTYETAYKFVEHWHGSEVAQSIILPDEERFAQSPRNISISMAKIEESSGGKIKFRSTLEGLKRIIGELG